MNLGRLEESDLKVVDNICKSVGQENMENIYQKINPLDIPAVGKKLGETISEFSKKDDDALLRMMRMLVFSVELTKMLIEGSDREIESWMHLKERLCYGLGAAAGIDDLVSKLFYDEINQKNVGRVSATLLNIAIDCSLNPDLYKLASTLFNASGNIEMAKEASKKVIKLINRDEELFSSEMNEYAFYYATANFLLTATAEEIHDWHKMYELMLKDDFQNIYNRIMDN